MQHEVETKRLEHRPDQGKRSAPQAALDSKRGRRGRPSLVAPTP
jgi:hypothetical protein